MGYRIGYGPGENEKKQREGSGALHLTLLFFSLFLLGVEFFWEDGRRFLMETVMGKGELSFTRAAAEMVENLSKGEAFGEVVACFCREIFAETGISG